jgi:hypothetical protein
VPVINHGIRVSKERKSPGTKGSGFPGLREKGIQIGRVIRSVTSLYILGFNVT